MENTNYLKAAGLLLAAGLLIGNTACSKTEQKNTETTVENTTEKAGNEGEEAYTSFKSYIEDADRDTAYVTYDHSRDWNKEISERETAYNERVTAVDKYSTDYDEARRAEIAEMKTRYATNWETRKNMYSTYAKGNQWRAEYLSIPAPATDLSSLNATNIRKAYETFVAKVQANKDSYSNDDWQLIDKFWTELDTRKNAVQDQLSATDKLEIGKAKTKYQAMKAASKTGNTAQKVGADVKQGAQEGAAKVESAAEQTGEAAKEGGSKVGEAAKKGGSKIGNAAKKVGSETKDLYKKGEDKVDGTKDKK